MNEITRISVPDYADEDDEPGENSLSKSDRNKARRAGELITAAFAWDETAEGDKFWNSVYARLNAIAGGEPLA